MRLGYLALSACIALGGVIFGGGSPGIAPEPAGATPAPPRDRVRIEQEIVRIPFIPVTRPEPGRYRKAAGHSIAAPPRVTTRLARSDKKDPILSRAVQRIVGNGRYTPQPFPRPAR